MRGSHWAVAPPRALCLEHFRWLALFLRSPCRCLFAVWLPKPPWHVILHYCQPLARKVCHIGENVTVPDRRTVYARLLLMMLPALGRLLQQANNTVSVEWVRVVDSERCAPLGKRTGGVYHARLECPFPVLVGGWWWAHTDVLLLRSLTPCTPAVFGHCMMMARFFRLCGPQVLCVL